MSEDNHIDNLFRSSLESYEPTPSEKVWGSLDDALSRKQAAIAGGDASSEKKKNRKRFLFLLFALLVGSFGAYEYFSGKVSSTEYQVLNTKPQTTPIEVSIGKMTITSSKELVADNSSKPAINIANKSSEKSSGQSVNSQVSVNGSYVHSPADRSATGISKSNTAIKSPASNRSSKHSTPTVAGNINGKQSDAEPKNANGGLYAKANTNEERKSERDDNKNNNTAEPTATSSNSSSEQAENSNTENRNGESQANASSSENPAPATSSETANMQPPPLVEAPAPPTIESKEPIGGFLTKLSVAGFYSPELANQYFKNSSSSAGQSAGTTSSEKFGPSFNTGALFRYDISDKGVWSVGVGLTYSTLEQITSLTTSYIVPSDTDHNTAIHGADSSFFHFSSSGSQHYTFNSSCGTVHLQTQPSFLTPHSNIPDTVKFTTNTSIQLKYINVPVIIRYSPDFLTKGRFSFYANVGMSFSFLVNKQAKVVIGDASNSYSETSNDISGLRSMYYGWLFGIGAQYQFYRGFSVFAEPSFRGSISSITDSNSQSFYPYSLGVNTGISYHF